MPNRWIVSSHAFVEHTSIEKAQAEMKRLTEKTGKKFKLYRIKTALKPSSPDPVEAEVAA